MLLGGVLGAPACDLFIYVLGCVVRMKSVIRMKKMKYTH
jgi:hypothetical protein